MKDRFEEIELLLKSKSYHELSDSERKLISDEIGSESTYDKYRSLLVDVNKSQSMSVSKSTSRDLQAYFKSKNKSFANQLFAYQTPAYLNLIAFLLVIGVAWWWVVNHPKIELVKEEVFLPGSIDTVMVQLPPDTVYMETIIQKEVPVYITVNTAETKQKEEVPQGSSLAEQSMLTDFLVSGK